MRRVAVAALGVLAAASVLGPWLTRGSGSEAVWLVALVAAGAVAIGASGNVVRSARRSRAPGDAALALLGLSLAAFVAAFVVFVSVVFAGWDP